MIIDLHIPTRVVFGRGRLSELGQHVRPFGHRVLLVSGRAAMRRHGVLDACVTILDGCGAAISIFDDISEDPLAEEVDRAVALAREKKCDVIVGLGGGSAIDAAKATSVGLKKGPVGPLVGTSLTSHEQMVPVVAVPTTAGSGAEVTKASIITDADRTLKAGIRGDCLFPAVALIDPDLLLTVPAPVAAATGFDALAHAVEGAVARHASPFTRGLAQQAVEILGRRLPQVVAGRADAKAREELAYAALLGGLNVAIASTCLPHRLQQAMSSVPRIRISHGRGLAAVYPAWLGRAVPYAQEQFAATCGLLGPGAPSEVIDCFLSAIGAKRSLSSHGFTVTDIPRLVCAVTGNTENDPIPDISQDTLRAIYEQSL